MLFNEVTLAYKLIAPGLGVIWASVSNPRREALAIATVANDAKSEIWNFICGI
jgi:hypothetical protein